MTHVDFTPEVLGRILANPSAVGTLDEQALHAFVEHHTRASTEHRASRVEEITSDLRDAVGDLIRLRDVDDVDEIRSTTEGVADTLDGIIDELRREVG